MQSSFPFVSVIVPTHRRPEAVRETLGAVTRVDYPPERFEVIVVDDGADDATATVVREAKENGPVVRYLPQESAGVARARNQGARLARGEVLLFLDDDMLVEPAHIRQHLATRRLFGDCLVNGHWEFSPDARKALEGSPFGRFRLTVEDWVKGEIQMRPLSGDCEAPSSLTACNLSLSRGLYWRLGGFDEDFPGAGYEDQDFSHRAGRGGCSFVHNRAIRLLHNDDRITLRQFCARQEQGALSAVFLASKHPEESRQPLIRENVPLSRRDSPAIIAKKLVKLVLSTVPGLALAHAGVDVIERTRPRSRLLRRAYWALFGLYIFRGVRRGVTAVGSDLRPLGSECSEGQS